MVCNNCGMKLSNDATFCPMCGARMVHAIPQQVSYLAYSAHPMHVQPSYPGSAAVAIPSTYSAPQSVARGGVLQKFSPMQRVRSIVALALIVFMFLPWVVNEATVIGQTSSVSMNLFTVLNPLGISICLAGLAAALAGIAFEVFKSRSFGRWISLAGFATFAIIGILVIVSMPDSAEAFYMSDSIAPTFFAWISVIMSGAAVGSCIAKG